MFFQKAHHLIQKFYRSQLTFLSPPYAKRRILLSYDFFWRNDFLFSPYHFPSYYKYKDDIFPIHEKIQGKTITFVMEMEDQPGLLSSILKIVADCKANILSIHQSIPVNHIALITLSVMILPITEDVAVLFDRIENADGINNLKIVSEE